MTDGTEVSEEMLMSLADGELQGSVAERLMQRVQSDPALAARYAVFVETRALVGAAYPEEPVPDRLVRTVMDTPMGVTAPKSANVVPLRRRLAPNATLPGLALAASLIVAVGVAGFLAGRGAMPVQIAGDPGAVAAKALSQSATGDSVILPGGQIARALASFETDLGLCRLIGLETTRAVVCRGDSGWATALAVTAGDGTTFLPASDTATGLIDDLLDQIGAGGPLDPAAERTALEQ